MAGLIRLNRLLLLPRTTSGSLITPAQRLIATTPKAKDASAATAAPCPPPAASSDTKQPNKNWVSYGFDFRDEAIDRSAMRASYFFSVTLCLVWGTFVWAYLPDPQMRSWAQRQGHLTLRAREKAGQEPISPDYVPPSTIRLPSEKDLAGVEIII